MGAHTQSGGRYFNPRTPRGVRQALRRKFRPLREFQSTHPARGATSVDVSTIYPYVFQSTHPARGATKYCFINRNNINNFNPRTPRGVRRCINCL